MTRYAPGAAGGRRRQVVGPVCVIVPGTPGVPKPPPTGTKVEPKCGPSSATVIVPSSVAPMSGESSRPPGGGGSMQRRSLQQPKPTRRNVVVRPSTTATGRAPPGLVVDVVGTEVVVEPPG